MAATMTLILQDWMTMFSENKAIQSWNIEVIIAAIQEQSLILRTIEDFYLINVRDPLVAMNSTIRARWGYKFEFGLALVWI
jgi:hypothetical protein